MFGSFIPEMDRSLSRPTASTCASQYRYYIVVCCQKQFAVGQDVEISKLTDGGGVFGEETSEAHLRLLPQAAQCTAATAATLLRTDGRRVSGCERLGRLKEMGTPERSGLQGFFWDDENTCSQVDRSDDGTTV